MQRGELCFECSQWNIRDWFSGQDCSLQKYSKSRKVRSERIQAFESRTGYSLDGNQGLLQDVKENKHCPLCMLIIKALSRDPAYAQIPEGAEVTLYYDKLYFQLECHETVRGKTIEQVLGSGTPTHSNRLVIRTKDPKGRHLYPVATGSIHMILSATNGDNYSRDSVLGGRLVQSQVDMKLIKSWIRRCDEDHGLRCRSFSRDEYLIPGFKLIDVNSRRIIHSSVQACFAALSYTWGPEGVRQLTLKRENYSTLTTGGLDEVWTEVPQTIRDAITLCESIGIPSLWVDALCIQQDDETDIGQVEYMDIIYGAAYLTIVAASGTDSWAGLPGVSPGSREIQQESEIIEGLSIGTAQSGYGATMSSAVWCTRGWTFQEYILSKRLLICTSSQVFYQCTKAFWWEDTYTEVPAPMTVTVHDATHYSRGTSGKPAIESLVPGHYLGEYMELAVQFTDRCLTRQSDALRAFQGIIGYFSRATGEHFFAGLPIGDIHAALLFHISKSKAEYRREEFPSWSWTGWNSSRLAGDYIRYEATPESYSWEPEAALYRIEDLPHSNTKENIFVTRIPDKRKSALSPEPYIPWADSPITLNKALLEEIGVSNLLVVIAPTVTISVSYDRMPWPATRDHSKDTLSSSILPWAIRERMGLACLYLDPSWRKLVGRKAECFAIARQSLRGPQGSMLTTVKLMVICTNNRGLSQRVALRGCTLEQWENATPKWKRFLLR